MRSSAATFDTGFDMPARGKGGRKKRAPTPAKRGARKSARLHALARYAAIAAGIAIALGIMVNALMLQKGHHPAPLFGKTPMFSHAANQTAAKTVAAPLATTQPAAAPKAVEMPAQVQEAARRPAAEPVAAGDDPIGRLLRTGSAATGGDRNGHQLSSAQRALGRLGFAVKASGTMDGATRKAIEAFDKAHHLPVKGELDRRTVKLLAAASGIHID